MFSVIFVKHILSQKDTIVIYTKVWSFLISIFLIWNVPTQLMQNPSYIAILIRQVNRTALLFQFVAKNKK